MPCELVTPPSDLFNFDRTELEVAVVQAGLQLPDTSRVAQIPKDSMPLRDDDQETIYQIWLSLDRNSAATQRAIYDYAGGKANYYCAYAINRALVRRGKPPIYKEQER